MSNNNDFCDLKFVKTLKCRGLFMKNPTTLSVAVFVHDSSYIHRSFCKRIFENFATGSRSIDGVRQRPAEHAPVHQYIPEATTKIGPRFGGHRLEGGV